MSKDSNFLKERPDKINIKYRWQFVRYVAPIILAVIGIMTSTQVFAMSMNGDPRIVGQPMFLINGKPVYNPVYYILSMFKYMYYDSFQPYYLNSIVYFLGFGIAALLIAIIWTFIINVILKSERNIYGTARFATTRELRSGGFMNKSGVVCGELNKAIVLAKSKQKYDPKIGQYVKRSGLSFQLIRKAPLIIHPGDVNTLLLMGTGGGKGVSFIIPTLLSWLYSTIIFDPKEENFEKTSGWRSKFSYVIKFAPCSYNTMRLNPVMEIRDGIEYAYRDSNIIADVIFAPSKVGGGQSDAEAYFSNSAKTIVTGALLYIRFCEYPNKTLKGLRDFLAGSNNLEALLKGGGEANNDLGKEQAQIMANAQAYFTLTQIMYHQKDYEITEERFQKNKKYYENKNLNIGDTGNWYEDHNIKIGDKIRSPEIETQLKIVAADILATNAKEKASVWKTIAAKIKDFDDPTLNYATSGSDFTISDFFNTDRPISLYLCVPYSDVARISFVFRMIISLMLKRFSEGATSFGNERLPYKILFLLDEFPILGCFPDIAEVMGVLRGYGVFFMIVAQALNQIVDRYGPNHPFLDHCDVHIVGQIGQINDAELYSRRIGQETVHQLKTSRSGGMKIASDNNINYSDNDYGRNLLDGADIMRIPGNQYLLMIKGMQPYLGKKVVYYQDPRFKNKAKIKHLSTMKELYSEAACLPSQIQYKLQVEKNRDEEQKITVTKLKDEIDKPNKQLYSEEIDRLSEAISDYDIEEELMLLNYELNFDEAKKSELPVVEYEEYEAPDDSINSETPEFKEMLGDME